MEYLGAVYHVMNRGDRREAIFLAKPRSAQKVNSYQFHQGLQDVRFRKHRSKVKRKVRLCPDINSPLSSSVKTLLPSRPKMSSAVVLRLTAIVSSRGLCALCWRPD